MRGSRHATLSVDDAVRQRYAGVAGRKRSAFGVGVVQRVGDVLGEMDDVHVILDYFSGVCPEWAAVVKIHQVSASD
jgi:hypothetical protein